MLLVDARRLTGPNLLARTPQVVVELALDVPDVLEHARDAYLQELARMRTALGFSSDVTTLVRAHRGGAVIAYEAPLDVMLACTEMSEWAALSACEILTSRAPAEIEPKRTEIEAMLVRDRSPNMLAVCAEAKRRGLPFLWDDETVSVGAGSRSVSWPRFAVPALEAVPWEKLGTIPIALVTGTNGKTTSSRLLARLVREAGHRVGSTSSDAITVGTQVIDEGDWTGPAAARTVLRHPGVDFAVLETARGGILRRGLAMDDCDAALITNVSEDHTGGYGIDDLAAMTFVKAVTAAAVHPRGSVVLNAHDPKLVALAGSLSRGPRIVFFADLDGDDAAAGAVVERHRKAGGSAAIAQRGRMLLVSGSAETDLIGVDDVPITFRGAARYNVENVLGVSAMARALGIADDAIGAGLRGFLPRDNPHRGEVIERGDVRVMLDFGHNPEGVRSVMQLVAALRGGRGRFIVVAGSAGDRNDHEIEEMSRAIVEAGPHRVFLRDLGGYLRGRLPGDVPRLLERALVAHGFPAQGIATVGSEVAALERARADAEPGDFILVLVHLDHADVQAFFDAWHSATP
jgi:UDP-N-acetylmuramyl tripeptide synthase